MVAFACKKETFPLPENGASSSPVFTVNGTVGEVKVDLQAGVNDALLSTKIEQKNNVNYYAGILKNTDESITISVLDGDLGLKSNLLEKLKSSLKFKADSTVWFSINQSFLSNAGKIQSLSFKVDGVEYGSELVLKTSGYHEICVDIIYVDGIAKSICNNVLIGFKDHSFYSVKQSVLSSNDVELNIDSPSSDVESVKWFLSGQLHSNTLVTTISGGMGVVDVTSEVTFKNGIVKRHTVLVDTDGNNNYFVDLADFINQTEDYNYNDYRVEIEYSKNGKTYKSLETVGNSGQFVMEKVTFYEKKSNGNSIYKIEGIINGTLIDLVSGDLLSSHLKVVFAVELP